MHWISISWYLRDCDHWFSVYYSQGILVKPRAEMLCMGFEYCQRSDTGSYKILILYSICNLNIYITITSAVR